MKFLVDSISAPSACTRRIVDGLHATSKIQPRGNEIAAPRDWNSFLEGGKIISRRRSALLAFIFCRNSIHPGISASVNTRGLVLPSVSSSFIAQCDKKCHESFHWSWYFIFVYKNTFHVHISDNWIIVFCLFIQLFLAWHMCFCIGLGTSCNNTHVSHSKECHVISFSSLCVLGAYVFGRPPTGLLISRNVAPHNFRSRSFFILFVFLCCGCCSSEATRKYAPSAHTRLKKRQPWHTRNTLRFFFCPSASFPFQLTYFGDEREMCSGLTASVLLCFVSSAVCFVLI